MKYLRVKTQLAFPVVDTPVFSTGLAHLKLAVSPKFLRPVKII